MIDDKDQEIVSLTDSSIKWEGLYVELKDSANISDSTIVDEDGNERIKVAFNYEEGINRVDGFTLTNPPEASIQFDWTRPIDLTTVIAKGDDGGWYAYIDSPDTSFMFFKEKKIDVLIGMYHDQVLTPFKALYNYNAINITLGLPYIRISPDHGVAENIIGKKIANPGSLIESIKFFNHIK